MESEKIFLLKVHKSYRPVVAICDKELYGKILEEGNKHLDISGQFFKGDEMKKEELVRKIISLSREDATFNIVGKESINLTKNLGIVKNEGIIYINEVPFALILL